MNEQDIMTIIEEEFSNNVWAEHFESIDGHLVKVVGKEMFLNSVNSRLKELFNNNDLSKF